MFCRRIAGPDVSIWGVNDDEDCEQEVVVVAEGTACDGSNELLSVEWWMHRTKEVTPVASSDNLNDPRNSCLGKCLQVILTLVLRDQSMGSVAAVVEIVVVGVRLEEERDAGAALAAAVLRTVLWSVRVGGAAAAGDDVLMGLNMAVIGFCFDVSSETDFRFLLSLLPCGVLESELAEDEHGDW